MYGKFIKGVTTGAVIGAVASVMLIPEFDRDTKRRIRRSRKMISGAAGDIYDNIRDWVK